MAVIKIQRKRPLKHVHLVRGVFIWDKTKKNFEGYSLFYASGALQETSFLLRREGI